MINEVAIVDLNKNIQEVEQTNKLCQMLMKTPHYAKMGQEGIYAVVAKAKSMGIDPMDALNGALYVVKGRVGMSTEQMACLVRQAGHSVTKDSKSNDQVCILHGRRKDNGDTWTVSFSVSDAKRAGIYQEKGPWGNYPSVMCYNRAMSMLFRQLFPDLSKGAGYTLDELKEIADKSEKNNFQSVQEAEFEEIKECITQEQCDNLGEVLSQCDPEYLQKVWKTLKEMIPPIKDLKDVPLALFERLMSAALKNRETYQAQLAKKDFESQQEAKP